MKTMAKSLTTNKFAKKSFSKNLLFRQIPPVMDKINAYNIGGMRNKAVIPTKDL